MCLSHGKLLAIKGLCLPLVKDSLAARDIRRHAQITVDGGIQLPGYLQPDWKRKLSSGDVNRTDCCSPSRRAESSRRSDPGSARSCEAPRPSAGQESVRPSVDSISSC